MKNNNIKKIYNFRKYLFIFLSILFFSNIANAQTFKIVEFAPASTIIGRSVGVSVSYPLGSTEEITSVTLNNKEVDSVEYHGSSSGNIVVFKVPEGATTGKIKITTKQYGSATSSNNLVINLIKKLAEGDTLKITSITNKTNEIGSANAYINGSISKSDISEVYIGDTKIDLKHVEPNTNTSGQIYVNIQLKEGTKSGKIKIVTTKFGTAISNDILEVESKSKLIPEDLSSGKKIVENSNVYEFLAPIGKITSMYKECDTSKLTCINYNIGDYLNFIFKFLIGLAAALAVVMLIIAGITYMGDESVFGKTEAKSKMFNAILGLLIALGSWALLNTINPDLTGAGGLSIDQVSVEIIDEVLDGEGESTIGDKVIKVSKSKIKYASEYSNKTACAGLSATESSPNVSTCVKYPTSIKRSASGQYVEKSFSEKLTKLNDTLKSKNISWRVTEAWPGTKNRPHKATCHKIGVCIDMNHTIGSNSNQTPTVAQVKTVIEAAAALGMCAQYEILDDKNLNNQLVKAGLGKNVIFFGGKWISANHYSLYNGNCV